MKSRNNKTPITPKAGTIVKFKKIAKVVTIENLETSPHETKVSEFSIENKKIRSPKHISPRHLSPKKNLTFN